MREGALPYLTFFNGLLVLATKAFMRDCRDQLCALVGAVTASAAAPAPTPAAAQLCDELRYDRAV